MQHVSCAGELVVEMFNLEYLNLQSNEIMTLLYTHFPHLENT